YLNLGGLYRELNLFIDSIKYQMKALKIFRKNKDKFGECKSLLNIGNIFGNLKNFLCSHNFQFRALKIGIINNYKSELPKIYFDIAQTYQNSLDSKTALTYYLKALNLFYSMLKEFKNVNLMEKFIQTFNILPFIINAIQKLRSGKNKFKKFDNPLEAVTIEFYTKGDNISPIRNILIKASEEILVISDAKELFDFKMENAEIIMNHLFKNDELKINQPLKDIFFQQIIVIMVNALEIYLKMRFIELNKKKNSLNLKKLYDFFIHANIRTKEITEIKELAIKKGLSEIEVFIEKNDISFQVWDDIINAYLLGYNIDFNKILPSKSFQDFINKTLILRQKIIHTHFNLPENFKFEFIIAAFSLFKESIEYIHQNSKSNDVNIDLKYLNFILNHIKYQKLNAKELFDKKIRNIDEILNYVENLVKNGTEDYRFKIIFYRQLLVMLITAFEIFSRTRFIELEEEFFRKNKEISLQNLFKKFISKRYRSEYSKILEKKSKKSGKSILLLLIEDRRINFKNWDHFKNAFKVAFGIKVGDIFKGHILDDFQKKFRWRNKIIHSKIESPTLNFEISPPEDPITVNKDLVRNATLDFQKFINNFHDYTKKLIS
ncbi:MAG: tetratricopeptide repeat protein, partial [Candidatus Lokiarchaeia archaeon]